MRGYADDYRFPVGLGAQNVKPQDGKLNESTGIQYRLSTERLSIRNREGKVV